MGASPALALRFGGRPQPSGGLGGGRASYSPTPRALSSGSFSRGAYDHRTATALGGPAGLAGHRLSNPVADIRAHRLGSLTEFQPDMLMSKTTGGPAGEEDRS